MDLGKFDVASAASAGADLALKHPATKEALLCKDGSPFSVRVVGNDAPSVKDDKIVPTEGVRIRMEYQLAN